MIMIFFVDKLDNFVCFLINISWVFTYLHWIKITVASMSCLKKINDFAGPTEV